MAVDFKVSIRNRKKNKNNQPNRKQLTESSRTGKIVTAGRPIHLIDV